MEGIRVKVVGIVEQALPGEALIDMLVIVDVSIVVKVDKIVASRLAENQNGGKAEQSADRDDHGAASPRRTPQLIGQIWR
jgi:hypothetical protein